MRPRILPSLALLVVAFMLERFAYYMTRSQLSIELREEGIPIADIGSIYVGMSAATFVGVLLGGVAAFALGPRIVAVAGMLLASVGHFAMSAAGPSLPLFLTVAFGAGLLRPCPFAVATEGFYGEDDGPPNPQRFLALSAFSVASFSAVDVGSFSASLLSGAFQSPSASHIAAGGVAFLGTCFAGGAWLLGILPAPKPGLAAAPKNPYRAAAILADAISAKPPQANVFGGLALLALPTLAVNLGANASYPDLGSSTPEWLYSVSPIASVLAGAGLFLLFAIATSSRESFPPLLVFGAGLIVAACGLAVLAVATFTHEPIIYALGWALDSGGELAVSAVGAAYAALAVRSRWTTMVIAGWISLPILFNLLSSRLVIFNSQTPMLLTSVLLCLAFGVGYVTSARRLHSSTFEPA